MFRFKFVLSLIFVLKYTIRIKTECPLSPKCSLISEKKDINILGNEKVKLEKARPIIECRVSKGYVFNYGVQFDLNQNLIF